MKAKFFLCALGALLFSAMGLKANAQQTRFIGTGMVGIYVDQQDPSVLWLETLSPLKGDVTVTIDYERKPEPGEPTDEQGKIISYFTMKLPAGQKKASSTCHRSILYYPGHNGEPKYSFSNPEDSYYSVEFDTDKFFPTFGMEFYPNYQ